MSTFDRLPDDSHSGGIRCCRVRVCGRRAGVALPQRVRAVETRSLRGSWARAFCAATDALRPINAGAPIFSQSTREANQCNRSPVYMRRKTSSRSDVEMRSALGQWEFGEAPIVFLDWNVS